MPSRRSVLAFLGLAPIAAPAAIAASTRPGLPIFGADVTEAGVALVRAGVVTPNAIRATAIEEYGALWRDALQQQAAFFEQCDTCSLVLPVDPVGDA